MLTKLELKTILDCLLYAAEQQESSAEEIKVVDNSTAKDLYALAVKVDELIRDEKMKG